MEGKTKVTVLQPWATMRYEGRREKKLKLFGAIGFGRELNIIAKGETVANGWMLSGIIGFNL